jgi:hypothetical protein
VARSVHQMVEVIHLVDGEDSPRRVLCRWRAHPLSLSCQQHLTLPAVARATAGRFVQCGWLLGRGVCVRCSCIGKDVGARRSFEPRDRARRSRDSDTRRRGCTADCVRVT